MNITKTITNLLGITQHPNTAPVDLYELDNENEADLIDEIDEEDDEYDDYDYFDELLTDDQWEDTNAYRAFKNQLPDGWHVIKISNFNSLKIKAIDEWLKEYCDKKYKRLGFSSGCAHTVGVGFESPIDATLFKLRW